MKFQHRNEECYSQGDVILDLFALRNINPEWVNDFYTQDTKNISDWRLLGSDKIAAARNLLDLWSVSNDKTLWVLVDCDCDGFCSAAILINFIHSHYGIHERIQYILHEGKEHGLDKKIVNQILDKGKTGDLVFIPDAGSNDFKAHEVLKNNGYDVVVFDHHEILGEAKDAIVISSQLLPYPNKYLSGAGVIWQFIRSINEDGAMRYLDLAALGIVADVMSLGNRENQAFISGFRNLKNVFLMTFAAAQAYSIGGALTPHNAAWYIAPFINSVNRIGTMEEKEMLFRSMVDLWALEIVESNKRGAKGEKVTLVTECCRVIKNVKTHQKKEEDSLAQTLFPYINKKLENDDKVFIFCMKPDTANRGIYGLTCTQIASKYKRPVMILTKNLRNIYAGSIRGYGDMNFKDDLDNSGLMSEPCIGHQNAAGAFVSAENVKALQAYLNELYKDKDFEPDYIYDFAYLGTSLDMAEDIKKLDGFKYCYGKDFDEPVLLVKDVPLDMCRINILSNRKMKINLPNRVDCIITDSDIREVFQSIIDMADKSGYIDILGTCNINHWGNKDYPQLLVTSYNIKENCQWS